MKPNGEWELIEATQQKPFFCFRDVSEKCENFFKTMMFEGEGKWFKVDPDGMYTYVDEDQAKNNHEKIAIGTVFKHLCPGDKAFTGVSYMCTRKGF